MIGPRIYPRQPSSDGGAKKRKYSSFLASRVIGSWRGTAAKRAGRPAILRSWLTLHARSEKALGQALVKVFRSTARRVRGDLVALARAGKLTAGAARSAAGSLTKEVKSAAKGEIKKQVKAGAVRELALHLPGKRAAPYLCKADPAKIKLPPAVGRAVDEYASDILKQPYWTDVGDGVRDALAQAVTSSQHQGESNDALAERIEGILGDDGTWARAMRIARTETTGALNAGQDAAREWLADEGLIKGKTWLAVMDNVTRDDHAEANEQTVGIDEPFIVGGEKCEHPGDFSLSAEQRVNCRCTTISVDKDG